MAQTIALYRGELTIATQSISTAFTNSSSGTASRLRIGYLSWTCDFAAVTGWVTVLLYPSGSTYPTIIAASLSASAARHVSGLPYGAVTSAINTGAASPLYYVPAFFNPTNATFISSNTAYASSTSPSSQLLYNQDVLIGPSDVVKINWYDNGGGSRSGVINYSFSTITES